MRFQADDFFAEVYNALDSDKKGSSMKYILIVDDEKLIRYSLSGALKNKDTEVIALEDGNSALKAMRHWFFDFCFLDIGLPDMTGIDVMKTVKLVSPRTKIVMMTGSSVDEAGISAIHENAWLLLTKPFDLLRIQRLVEEYLSVGDTSFQELETLESRLRERRREQRRETDQPVIYVSGRGMRSRERRAQLIDISDSGTRIRTVNRLKPGSTVRFKNIMNDVEGVVQWSANEQESANYLAGIRFVKRQ